jgi:triosephosphate isomerase (TIM)
MRRNIIAGNWKMHMTGGSAVRLLEELKPLVASAGVDAEVVVCPPFTALHPVRDSLAGTSIALGAQNVFWKDQGAYTGQIAPSMLTDLAVSYVIVGHSEARGRFGVPEPDFDEEILRHFGDSDSTVNRKLLAALRAGITPICCVGETISERRSEQTDDVVRSQTAAALMGVEESQAADLVFAYEPVWAIGTGEVCDAQEADRVCGLIRETVGGLYTPQTAERVRIQYGGSMKPDNAAELLAKPNVDGGLVGGASLKAADFAAIVRAACGLPNG